MNRHMPSAAAIMAPFPCTVDAECKLAEAAEIMKAHDIHHLPVLSDGDIVGIINSADLNKAVTLGHPLEAEQDLTVNDLVTHRAYLIDINDPLKAVVQSMMKMRLDAAIVLKEGEFVGIITQHDIMTHYCHLLDQLDQKKPGNDVA